MDKMMEGKPMAGEAEQAMPEKSMQAPPELQRIGLAVQKIVYNPKIADGLVQMIQQAGDPIQGIAGATMVVLQKIMQSAKGIDPEQLSVIAGTAAAAHVAVLAQAAGLVKLDDKTIPAVLQAMAGQGQGGQQEQQAQQGGMIAQQMQQPTQGA